MKRTKAINLSDLTRTHSDEIDQMMVGISDESAHTLWTASMRPATRGGKCGFLRPEDEALLTDRAD
jgi:hypothetical protein